MNKAVYNIVAFLLNLYYRLTFRVKVTGKEKMQEYIASWQDDKENFIIASNHVHWGDPLVLAAVFKQIRIRYMAKKEVYANIFGRFFMSLVGAFPVDRQSADIGSLKRALTLLKKGENLGIFPEGTRNKSGKPMMAKGGMSMIARKAKIRIIPISIKYGFRKIEIFVHDAVYVGEFFQGKPTSDDYEEWTNNIMKTIYSKSLDKK